MAGRSKKPLDDPRTLRVRAIAKEVWLTDFAEHNANAAKALGVKPPTLHNFLAGKRDAGLDLIDGIVAHTGRSYDDVLGYDPVLRDVRVELDERYPNRAIALRRAGRVFPSAARRVLSIERHGTDMPVEWWLAQIEAELDRALRDEATPSRGPERAERSAAQSRRHIEASEAGRRAAGAALPAPDEEEESPEGSVEWQERQAAPPKQLPAPAAAAPKAVKKPPAKKGGAGK